MGITQPCFFMQKNNKLNGIERLSDKNQKNPMTNNDKINIGVQKINNDRKINSIEVPKHKKLNINISTKKDKLLILPELKTENSNKNPHIKEYEKNKNENTNDSQCKIIKKKKRHKSPNLLKRSNILNDENILIKRNFIKGTLRRKEKFCTVYSGLSDNGEMVTIKEYNNLNENKKKAIIENREKIYKINHPNIIKVISLPNDIKDEFSIIYEYLELKDVEEHIKNFGTLNEEMIQVFGKQLLLGLKYMHNKKIFHKNLKSSNILFDIDGTIKIVGCLIDSLILGDAEELYKDLLNSNYIEYYTPPFFIKKINKYINESKFNENNNEKNIVTMKLINNNKNIIFEDWQSFDLWFAGCILIEISSGKKPWSHYNFKNNLELFDFLNTTNLIPDIPKKISYECKELIQILLDPILTNKENIYETIFDLNFFKLKASDLKYQTNLTNITNSLKKSANNINDSYNNLNSETQLGKILEKNKVVNILNSNNGASFSISCSGEDSSLSGSIFKSNIVSPNVENNQFDFKNKDEVHLSRLATIKTEMEEVKELQNEHSICDKTEEIEENLDFDKNI